MPSGARFWRVLSIVVAAAATALLAGLAYWKGDSGRDAQPDHPGILSALPTVIVRVNGQPVTRADLVQALAATPDPVPEDLRAAATRLIDRALITQALGLLERVPERRGPDPTEDLLAGQVVVRPEEVEAFWMSHRTVFYGDFVSVRRVAGASEQEAKDLQKRLIESFRTTVSDFPDDPVEWIGRGELDLASERVLESLTPGQVSDPVRSGGRYQVFQVLARKPASETSFEDWKPRLTNHLRSERWHRERTRWLRIRAACSEIDGDESLDLPSPAAAVDYFRDHPDVAALVNGGAITFEALDRLVAQHRSMNAGAHRHHPVSEGERRAVLARMIESRLIRDEGEKRGGRVEEAEVQERLRSFRMGFASDAELDRMLRANATNLAEWLDNTRNGLLSLKTEQTEEARLPVDPEEIEEYWDQNKTALSRDRVRDEARQEAGAQTAADHQDRIAQILRHTRWLQSERLRWVFSLMDRGRIWNRFDLTLKLGQRPPAGSEALRGNMPALLVVAAARSCSAGLCESVGEARGRPVPVRFIVGPAAERVAQDWNLPTLPWAFALDAKGLVAGECPGPVTDRVLDRLARVFKRTTGTPGRPAAQPAIGEARHAAF